MSMWMRYCCKKIHHHHHHHAQLTAGNYAQAGYYGDPNAHVQPQHAPRAAGLGINMFDPASLDALRESILAEPKDSKNSKKKEKKEGATMRIAGGEVWYDDTLDSWPKNDFRIFVGNLGPEVRFFLTFYQGMKVDETFAHHIAAG